MTSSKFLKINISCVIAIMNLCYFAKYAIISFRQFNYFNLTNKYAHFMMWLENLHL